MNLEDIKMQDHGYQSAKRPSRKTAKYKHNKIKYIARLQHYWKLIEMYKNLYPKKNSSFVEKIFEIKKKTWSICEDKYLLILSYLKSKIKKVINFFL